MDRIIQPELLDELPPDDPRARRSRRDLRRVNAWMRNHSIMTKALRAAANGHVPGHITDFGAGDGNLLLRVAHKMSPQWRRMDATLLDRQRNVSSQTLASFESLGWRAEALEADVFNWLPTAAKMDFVVTNLFLHHFEEERLRGLFRNLANQAHLFVAIEPHRAAWPLFCCRWLWAMGCNAVTRHDARVSVRAGFTGGELSALWPADKRWELTERRSGFFSHLFVARRMD